MRTGLNEQENELQEQERWRAQRVAACGLGCVGIAPGSWLLPSGLSRSFPRGLLVPAPPDGDLLLPAASSSRSSHVLVASGHHGLTHCTLHNAQRTPHTSASHLTHHTSHIAHRTFAHRTPTHHLTRLASPTIIMDSIQLDRELSRWWRRRR